MLSAVVGIALSGCASDEVAVTTSGAQAPAGTRQTCPEAVLGFVPDDLTMVSRDLVPYSPSTMGVTTLFESSSGDRVIKVISGGFMDEVTEAYDNLTVQSPRIIAASEATVLVGSVLDVEVRVAAWRPNDIPSPCDVHAIVGTGISEQEYDRVLDAIRVS